MRRPPADTVVEAETDTLPEPLVGLGLGLGDGEGEGEGLGEGDGEGVLGQAERKLDTRAGCTDTLAKLEVTLPMVRLPVEMVTALEASASELM